MIEKEKLLIIFSEKHKKHPTKSELILWKRIRGRQFNAEFVRQEIFPPDYIVDFVSHPKKLIIEVDGPYHKYNQKYDKKRTEYLESKGYRVIRFTNEEVLNNLTKVMTKIKDTLYPNTP